MSLLTYVIPCLCPFLQRHCPAGDVVACTVEPWHNQHPGFTVQQSARIKLPGTLLIALPLSSGAPRAGGL